MKLTTTVAALIVLLNPTFSQAQNLNVEYTWKKNINAQNNHRN